MNYDPNPDHEQENFPEVIDAVPSQQEEPQALVSGPEYPQPEDFSQEISHHTEGRFARNVSQEEPEAPVAYHGRFAAKEQTSNVDIPAQETEVEAPLSSVEADLPPVAPEENAGNDGGFIPPLESPDPPAEPEDQAPVPQRRRAVRKGRPRRKKGEGLFGIPNILVTGVWVALTVLIGVTLGRLVWVCASEILAFGREDKSVTITIYETDTLDDITKKLNRAELIHYPGLFKLYAKLAVDDGDIKPGMWDLNTKYDYHALVKMMSPSSSRDVVKVMIPEGYSCRQIFALLEENKVCTVQDMESYAATGTLNDYWFLDGVARGDRYCLEGFLFPDTYEFYQNDTPKSVLTKMLNNFDTRFDEELRGKIQTLNNHLTDLMRRDGKTQDYIDSHLFSVRDVVNVASMIEKETASAQESYTIASVIYNRLFCWHGNPAYLNIDATIIYALNGKTDLTAEDLRVDSPYNTYTNIGLTPGPISNPGLSSIRAALEPADTNYYFYVLDPTAGTHVFATTQEEHEANRARLGG